MPTEPARSAQTLQLIRLVKAALDQGYQDAGAAPPPTTAATSVAVSGFIMKHQRRPSDAILHAYLHARCQANKDPRQLPPADGPSPPPEQLKQALYAWLQRRKIPPPADAAAAAAQDPDYYLPELLTPLLQHALALGYNDEHPQAALAPDSLRESAALLLNRHPDDPHQAVFKAYLGGRAQALANRIDRQPSEEPERWLRQAAANWLREQSGQSQSIP